MPLSVVLCIFVNEFLLVGCLGHDGLAGNAVADHPLYTVGLSLFAFDDVEDVLVQNTVVFQYVHPHFLYVFLNLGHFLLIAKDADDIISCHDAQFGEKRFEHLQVTVVDAVEHYRVNVF